MVDKIVGERNVQIVMIVWDIDLRIAKKELYVDIITSLFSINPIKKENINWIKLQGFDELLSIESNLSTLKEFKECTTYMINPATNTVSEEYKGFILYSWNQNEWNEKKRFVFKLQMHSDSPAAPPIIWIRCATEIKPPTQTNGILLKLEPERSTQTVLNNQGALCEVKTFSTSTTYNFTIIPEKPSENWSLLTEMLRKKEDNTWEWCYFHTTTLPSNTYDGRSCEKFYPRIIFRIMELSTSIENMSVSDISAVKSVIKSHASDKKELQPLNILLSPILLEYYTTNKLCDITVQVGNQKIRAHKVVLAAASAIWRNLFFEDETCANILINDFDYGTMKELIEFTYTGVVGHPTQMIEQLFLAAAKYEVAGLKELCEGILIETIDMKTVVNLLVLADCYEANELSDKALEFIEQNCEAFKELEEAKTIFMMCPELAFKLFARIA